MRVFVVTRDGKVDQVFDRLSAAEHHKAMLTRKWHVSNIIEREVKSL